jgi:hypothetical protein
MRHILKVVLQEINQQEETDYQSKDVYFDFEREIMTNALDNAQIEQTDAQTEQTRINTLLGLEATLGSERVVKMISEVLDLDWDEIKDDLPDKDDEIEAALNELRGSNEQETETSGGSGTESGSASSEET